jgi:hypothetical protein
MTTDENSAPLPNSHSQQLSPEELIELKHFLPLDIPSDLLTEEQFKNWFDKVKDKVKDVIPNPLDRCTYLVKVNTLGIQVAGLVLAAKEIGQIRDFDHCMQLASDTEGAGKFLTNGAVGAVAKEMVECSCKWIYNK